MRPKNPPTFILWIKVINITKNKTVWNIVNDLLAIIINAFHVLNMNNSAESSEMNILALTLMRPAITNTKAQILSKLTQVLVYQVVEDNWKYISYHKWWQNMPEMHSYRKLVFGCQWISALSFEQV